MNLLWKLLTGIVNEKVYDHLNQQNLLPEEQKSCRQRTRGTKDQLLIDKAVVRNSCFVYRLYIPRSQGGIGLLGVKDCIELERSNLFDYTANNNERLLKAANEELQLRIKIDGKNKEERVNERQTTCKEKALHDQFLRETEGMQDQRRWQ